MIDLLLHEHEVHPWHTGTGLSVRGWFFHADNYFEGADAHAYLSAQQDALASVVPELNGAYAVIVTDGTAAWMAVDRLRSFPLFYSRQDESVIVTDRVESLPGVGDPGCMDADAVREYLAAGFVTGHRTLYRHVHQLQAGQYATVRGSVVECFDHYIHQHSAGSTQVDQQLEQLDDVVQQVFSRLVTGLAGRPVALLLSGGYDSRLVAVGLRRAGYDNVVCLSFGDPRSREVRVAREVAEELGYPWRFIDVPRRWLKGQFGTTEFRDFILRAGNGTSTPYFMGLLVGRAVESGLVERDSVVVTGNSGDVLEGDQISSILARGESHAADTITDAVIMRHYMLWGRSFSAQPELRELAASTIPGGQDAFSRDEALDIEERFNWRERQAKYVIQDARCYEGLGMDWRFPLWDHGFMDFWLQVPSSLRINRGLYLDYVKDETMRTANVKTNKMAAASWVKSRSKVLTRLLYPVEKLRHFLFSYDPYYVVGLPDYLRILRLTGGHRTTTITTHLYREMLEIYPARLPVDDPRDLMRARR